MQKATAAVIGQIALFQRVSAEDRERLVGASWVRDFDRGEMIFDEGDPSDTFYVLMSGRVKVFKRGPDGHDVILELFGPGSPLGAVATYESRPYPASATPLEPSSVLLLPRDAFFALLERHPSLVRGLLGSLSLRLVELTTRLTEMAGGRVEARLARLFIKLAERLGEVRDDGTFIPLPLSRQELADMVGTTIETAIRVMSRWSKDDVLLTTKDGFVLANRRELESVAES